MSRTTRRPSIFAAASSGSSRRQFLSRASGAAIAAGVIANAAPFQGLTRVLAAEDGMPTGSDRASRAYQIRQQAALSQKEIPAVNHPTNGDDELYANRIASYSKALPHNALGEVEPSAYKALTLALTSGRSAAFEDIPLAGSVKQSNPQAALAFELEGTDSHNIRTTPPPAFNSAEAAAEMVELYWQALARDLPFAAYETSPLARAAIDDLSKLPAFRGPKNGDRILPGQLFRGQTTGEAAGPYISQFLWKDVPQGAMTLVQKIRASAPQLDYMTAYPTWLHIQNGGDSWSNQLDATTRYIHNGRDLAQYVHQDYSYQAFLNACLILMKMNAPHDAGNPYKNSAAQTGFCTFGAPHFLDAVARVANCSLKASWYQKWMVHRRLRPEEFGGRIHNHWNGAASYPIHSDVLKSAALETVFRRYGTYLLPQAYPEGCPTHPAYPAGHAVVAGACATVLKAFYDESFVLQAPVIASSDGLSLLPYKGAELTLGGELNKLAANIAMGRNFAGVHWRSDAAEGLKLGEAVALSMMMDMKDCYNERFGGFTLTKFDGKIITI